MIRNWKRLLLLCMTLALCLSSVTASAATVTRDNVRVTLTTDKKVYQAGENIRASLTIENLGDNEIKPVTVSYDLPQMCLPASAGATTQDTGMIGAGEAVTLDTTMVVSGNPDTAVPHTGDTSSLLMWLVLAGVSVFGLSRMNAQQRKRLFALLLCVALTGSMLPSGAGVSAAKAEEAQQEEEAPIVEPDSASDADNEEIALDAAALAADDAASAAGGELKKTLALVMQNQAKGKVIPFPTALKTEITISEPVTIMGVKTELSATLVVSPATEFASAPFSSLIGKNLLDTITSKTTIVYDREHTGANTVLPASAHNYSTNLDQLYMLYGGEGTVRMSLFFNSSCELESNYDALLIYDAGGNYVGGYTGTALRNVVLTLNGDGFFLRLVTDSSRGYYGFGMTKVIPHKPPTLAQVYLNGSSKPVIKWSRLYGHQGYVIERAPLYSNGKPGTFTRIATNTTSNVIMYTDTKAQMGKAYAYRVRQFTTVSRTRYTSPCSGNKGVFVLGKTTLTSGTAAMSGSQPTIRLRWNAVANATEYRVYRSTSQNGTYTQVGTSTSTTFLDKVPAKSQYFYKVRAAKSYGGQTYVGTYSAAKQFGFMVPPSTLKAESVNSTSVKLTWSKVTGADGYAVYSSTDEGGPYTCIARTTANSRSVKPATTRGLSYYKVRSYTYKNGVYTYSDGYSDVAAIFPLTAPAGVAGKSNNNNGNVRVTWRTVPNAETYKVYYSTTANGTYKECGESSTNSKTLTNLPKAYKTIYFKVRAVRKDSTSNYVGNVTGRTVTSMSPMSSPVRVNRNLVTVRNLYIYEQYAPGGNPMVTYQADRALLNSMFATGSPYGMGVSKTYAYTDQSRSQIYARINTMARLADSNDVTVFVMSCHGMSSVKYGKNAGALGLSDNTMMTFGQLATALKRIPGRVVIMLTSCGSGSAINKIASSDGNTEMDAETYVEEFVNTFKEMDEEIVIEGDEDLEQPSHGELRVSGKFYVIATARGGESGWYNNSAGAMLFRWMEMGVDDFTADINDNNVITLDEMGEWLDFCGDNITINRYDYMYPQVYPNNSAFPLFVKH